MDKFVALDRGRPTKQITFFNVQQRDTHGRVYRVKKLLTGGNVEVGIAITGGILFIMAQVIRIKLKAFEHSLIDEACKRIIDTAEKFGAKVAGPIPLPTDREVVTVIRSPHKYKDSREQFESRTHKRLIDIYSPSAKAVDALMKIDLPAGVDIKIKL